MDDDKQSGESTPTSIPSENKENNLHSRDIPFYEKRFDDALTFYKLTLKIITFIFVFASVFIGLFTWSAKDELNSAIQNIEKRFLKIPDIYLYYKGKPLEGHVIPISGNKNDSIATYSFPEIEIQNRGSGASIHPSINICFVDSIYSYKEKKVWFSVGTEDEYYKYKYQILMSTFDTPDIRTIFPSESEYIKPFTFTVNKDNNEMKCKIEVFTEGDPAIAYFTLKLSNK
jgi:hypothetical protein